MPIPTTPEEVGVTVVGVGATAGVFGYLLILLTGFLNKAFPTFPALIKARQEGSAQREDTDSKLRAEAWAAHDRQERRAEEAEDREEHWRGQAYRLFEELATRHGTCRASGCPCGNLALPHILPYQTPGSPQSGSSAPPGPTTSQERPTMPSTPVPVLPPQTEHVQTVTPGDPKP